MDGQKAVILAQVGHFHFVVAEITQPVRKDGREHIGYVPSQVLCEWFAQVFHPTEQGGRLDGLIYPSAVAPGGRNLVLFPTARGYERGFDSVAYRSATPLLLPDWPTLTAAIE